MISLISPQNPWGKLYYYAYEIDETEVERELNNTSKITKLVRNRVDLNLFHARELELLNRGYKTFQPLKGDLWSLHIVNQSSPIIGPD